VDGAPADYSSMEAVAGAFSRAGGAVRSGFGLLGKVIGMVLLALAVAFGYLFFTMEREAGIEKEIARQEQQIQVLQKELSVIEQEEISPLEEQIEALEREGYTRRHKVRLMELSVQRDELEEKAGAVQGKIEQHRRSIRAAEESLRVLKEKGFFERLLRQ
jgi:peptidoglycan hydrolase CwlO-like protein